MKTALVLVSSLALASANTYCEQTFTATIDMVRFEGKMNVPIKPAVEPGKVLFLWPGLNPYQGQGGLMQPVLTYGADYGQGNGKWGFANWFSDCPGYCHDDYQAVEEGDTLHFYMQEKEIYANGSSHWEMGYQSYNYPNTRSTFQVYREAHGVSCVWATEAEFYLTPEDNPSKLPLSYYYTWDLKATDRSGKDIPMKWSAHIDDPQGNRVNCSTTVVSNGTTFQTTMLSYTPFVDGCSTGFDRKWNEQCTAACGCNNKDGTPKVACDYCCSYSSGICQREHGPTPPTTTQQEVPKTLPHPRCSTDASCEYGN